MTLDRGGDVRLRCPETDKFLLLYFVLKMKLIAGKAIIFVNSIERCYRVKLFLEQFTLNTWYGSRSRRYACPQPLRNAERAAFFFVRDHPRLVRAFSTAF